MLKIYMGRNRLLPGALVEVLRTAPEETQIIAVPRQLTLQTERMLLDAMQLEGSFRLQVISSERLCARIFEAAGQPEGVRVDERGRVMLVREAAKAVSDRLRLYRGAEHRRGFAERAADQLEQIRQAGLNPQALRACADETDGQTSMKLYDLALILEAYEERIRGRYMDGETELSEAIARVDDCPFLRESAVWFYGWDVTSPMLNELIAATAKVCPSAGVFLPLEKDEHAPDFDVFRPLRQSCDRLRNAAARRGTPCEEVGVTSDPDAAGALVVPDVPRHSDLARIERELFADRPQPSDAPARAVSLTQERNPRRECAYAAALVRRLVLKRGWHWNDVLVLLNDTAGYSAPLRAAFDEYGIPLSLTEGRAAARHPVSECLLTALKLIEKHFLPEDMLALLRTGMMPVSSDEAERFSNYIVQYGIRGSRFLAPLRRGGDALCAQMEPIRARIAAPLERLRDGLRQARALEDQLRALFAFLTEIEAWEHEDARIQRLIDAGLRETAGEEAQVWNRILGTLDQLLALMDGEKLPLSELREHLTDSLSASIVKTLPISGDAVAAQSVDVVCTRAAKAVLILGAADSAAGADDGLLTSSQRQEVARRTRAWLGPADADKSRLRRFSLKCALGMASEYVSISCPMSAADGHAQRPNLLFERMRALFPGTKVRGGLTEDPGVERMLRASPQASVNYTARALSATREGYGLPETDAAALAALARIGGHEAQVELLRSALDRERAAQMLRPETAQALYGALNRQSITSLERFARCPFTYYANYGLKPTVIEPYELTPANEGTFFHLAVQRFVEASMADLAQLEDAQAAARMDDIAAGLLNELTDGPLGDSAVSMARRRGLESTARAAGVLLARHMRGSLFRPVKVEAQFGPEDAQRALTLPGGCTLYGTIDRVDAWGGDGERYLRIIDYKRGGKDLALADAYYGLRLQLPIYLAAEQRRTGALSAGVYYFPIRESLPPVQSTDPNAVESARTKELVMHGLLPDDDRVRKAMTPSPNQVFAGSIRKDGQADARTVTADQDDYRRLTQCALRRAAGHLEAIRSGECAPAPSCVERQGLPCDWCKLKSACLFNDELDAATLRLRRKKRLKPREVLELLRQEEEEEAQAAVETRAPEIEA